MFSYLFSDIASYLTGSDFLEKLYAEQSYVFFIYDILFISLCIMNFIIILFLITPKESRSGFFKKYFILIEFCINFPITLGVMGTLISISDALSNNQTDLANIISGNFSAAILTTVMGGAIYGYSFLSQALMSKHVN